MLQALLGSLSILQITSILHPKKLTLPQRNEATSHQ